MTKLCLYQTIHLFGGRPRLVDGHVAALDGAAHRLFGIRYAPDRAQLEQRIVSTAEADCYPHDLTSFVRLELTADGEERLSSAGVSLYEGYALRSLRPDGATLCYEMPLDAAPTSAYEAVTRLAQARIEQSGVRSVVQCDAEGRLRTIDGAPLFAVRNGAVYTPPFPDFCAAGSVERSLVLRACEAARIRVTEYWPFRSQLDAFDELFYADCRGITALAHCDGHPFMSIVAERIAIAMEALFDARPGSAKR